MPNCGTMKASTRGCDDDTPEKQALAYYEDLRFRWKWQARTRPWRPLLQPESDAPAGELLIGRLNDLATIRVGTSERYRAQNGRERRPTMISKPGGADKLKRGPAWTKIPR